MFQRLSWIKLLQSLNKTFLYLGFAIGLCSCHTEPAIVEKVENFPCQSPIPIEISSEAKTIEDQILPLEEESSMEGMDPKPLSLVFLPRTIIRFGIRRWKGCFYTSSLQLASLPLEYLGFKLEYHEINDPYPSLTNEKISLGYYYGSLLLIQ